jgi:segregation and condensation protein B
MEPSLLDRAILALLFASDEPLSVKKVCSVIDDVEAADVRASLDRIAETLRSAAPSIVLENVAGGSQLSTNPEYAEFVARLYSGRRKQRLSKAGLEALAIIAYKQPITRADVENVRGVSCGGVITTLMERSLIRIVGKAKVLGSPFLYGTTQEFLEYLGINSLKDLPNLEELEALLEREENQSLDAAGATPAVSGATVEDFGFPGKEEQGVTGEDQDAWEAQLSSTDGPETEEGPDTVEADR